jgi:hypothetical protein
MNWFANRTLVIATQHGKEKVIAPLLEHAFSLHCVIPEQLNTDLLGTFSGEIERQKSPLETARLKGREAALLLKADLVLSSEGSFGPHPNLFFLPCNQELLLLQDLKHGFEISVSELSTDTNYAGEEINNLNELLNFAKRIGFPQHAIILKDRAKEFKLCIKGLFEEQVLIEAYHSIYKQFSSVYAETDMRAMHNPRRMQVIKITCEKLVQRMQNGCPHCSLPGFGVISYTPGLPCSWCGNPTSLPCKQELSCPHCSFSTVQDCNHDSTADPGYCSICNP